MRAALNFVRAVVILSGGPPLPPSLSPWGSREPRFVVRCARMQALRLLGRVCMGDDPAAAERRERAVAAGALRAIVGSLDVRARAAVRAAGAHGGHASGHAFAEAAAKALPVLRLLCGGDDGRDDWWRRPEYEAQLHAHPAVLAALEWQLAAHGPMPNC